MPTASLRARRDITLHDVCCGLCSSSADEYRATCTAGSTRRVKTHGLFSTFVFIPLQKKFELQSLPDWVELRDYMRERVADCAAIEKAIDDGAPARKQSTKGFG